MKQQCNQITAKQLVEVFLFSTNQPLSLSRLQSLLKETHRLSLPALRAVIEELQAEYQEHGRAFQIEELPQGFFLRARKMFHSYLEVLAPHRKANRLSQAALEVLAIIAYRQPITRVGIEAIRGIDSSGLVSQLLERELIVAAGRLEVPGKPMQYRTSTKFLIHFGLHSLDELVSTGIAEESQ